MLRRCAFVVILILSASGCDTSTLYHVIAVSKSGENPRIHWFFCDDPRQRVTDVRLVELVGDSVWDGDDPILWEIQSRTGRDDTSEFVAGDTPKGFEVVRPLRGGIPGSLLGAAVETTGIGQGIVFSMDDLHATKLLDVNGELMTRREFTARAASAC